MGSSEPCSFSPYTYYNTFPIKKTTEMTLQFFKTLPMVLLLSAGSCLAIVIINTFITLVLVSKAQIQHIFLQRIMLR